MFSKVFENGTLLTRVLTVMVSSFTSNKVLGFEEIDESVRINDDYFVQRSKCTNHCCCVENSSVHDSSIMRCLYSNLFE